LVEEAAVAVAFVHEAYVYWFLVVLGDPAPVSPKANIPFVLFPAAEPPPEPPVDAVAEELVSLEYVYLFLVVDGTPQIIPKANIPNVLFPAAAP